MKQKLIDILLLRKIDRYLLKNYPAVWQTKGHYVLIYAVLIGVISFLIGYGITATNNLTVPPLQQLFLNYDDSFLFCFAIAVLFILYWMFTQYKTQQQAYHLPAFLVSLLIYFIGIAFILLLNTTAYRLGTICKSKNLMAQADMDTLKANNFYMYGYTFNINEELDFNTEQERFKQLVLKEDTLLNNRYILDSLSPRTNWSDIFGRLYRSDLSDLSSGSYLPNPSYRSYLSAWITFNLSKKNIEWQLLEEKINNSNWIKGYKNKISWLAERGNLKGDSLVNQLPVAIKQRYLGNTEPEADTATIQGILFKHYPYLFTLEDIAWSTQHAQLYLKAGIWYKNAKMLLPLVLFFSLFMAMLRYFKVEEIAIGALLTVLGLFVYTTFSNAETESFFSEMMKSLSYLHLYGAFAVATILSIGFALVRKKANAIYYVSLSMVLVLLAVLFTDVLGLHNNLTAQLPGFNFELDRYIQGEKKLRLSNDAKLYPIPFVGAFIGLLTTWFMHQKPWAK